VSRDSPHHQARHEILLGLAADLRQALAWLGQQDEEPPWQAVRSRLRTLREAATFAGLASAEALLARLEQRYQAEAPGGEDAEPTRLEEALAQLTQLIVQLAAPVEAEELAWFGDLARVEQTLARLALETEREAAALRLTGQQVVVSPLPGELAAELDRQLRGQLKRLRAFRQELTDSSDCLRQAGRALAQELAAAHRVPLEPLFARLRERVRRHGRATGRPASLAVGGQRLDAATAQHEPLSRALDEILDGCLLSALQDPAARRAVGKPTVAALRLESQRLGGVISLDLTDDGPHDRALPPLSLELRRELTGLRARLWRDPSPTEGLRLVLQVPIWYSSLEAIPMETAAGQVLVPTAAVEQVLTAPPGDLPTLRLERRRGGPPQEDELGLPAGVVCRVGPLRARLPGHVLGPPLRVLARPSTDDEAPWILGRADGWPLLHPLPLIPGPPGWIGLHPEEKA
jgi:hypothetical protein